MGLTRIRYLVDKLPPSWSRLPLAGWYWIRNGKQIKGLYKRIKGYESTVQNADRNTHILINGLKQYCLYMNRAGADKYLDSYLYCKDFQCLQRFIPNDVSSDDVILLCCVRNDYLRIQNVVRHHKSIGVKHMVFVDNGSTDGTLEYLCQNKVDVYQTTERYHAGAKSSWVRKVMDIYGYGRWYLIVDSDELFSYPGMESHSIIELISYAKKNRIRRVRSMLLDMYSNEPLFQGQELTSAEEIVFRYSFFDCDSYYHENDCRGIMLRGGPRKRVFESESDYAQPLTKYPLIFAQFEDFWADHTPIPFEKNFDSPCLSVLRHYKFLPEDQKKFIKIIRDGNYAHGSYEYKNYIKKFEENNKISFYYEGSQKYLGSESLKFLSFLESIF